MHKYFQSDRFYANFCHFAQQQLHLQFYTRMRAHSGSRVRIKGGQKRCCTPILSKIISLSRKSIKSRQKIPKSCFERFLSIKSPSVPQSTQNNLKCQYFLSPGLKEGIPHLPFWQKKADPPTPSYPPKRLQKPPISHYDA
jgi:hypothetical protein